MLAAGVDKAVAAPDAVREALAAQAKDEPFGELVGERRRRRL